MYIKPIKNLNQEDSQTKNKQSKQWKANFTLNEKWEKYVQHLPYDSPNRYIWQKIQYWWDQSFHLFVLIQFKIDLNYNFNFLNIKTAAEYSLFILPYFIRKFTSFELHTDLVFLHNWNWNDYHRCILGNWFWWLFFWLEMCTMIQK